MGAFSDSDEEEGGEAGAALEQGFFGQAVLPEDFKAKGLRMSVGLVDCKPGEVMEFILDRPGEPTRRKVSKNTYTTEPATWKGLAVGCVGSLAGNRLDLSKPLLRGLYLASAQPIEVPVDLITPAATNASIPANPGRIPPESEGTPLLSQVVPLPGPAVRKSLALARREGVNKLLAYQQAKGRRCRVLASAQ